MKRVLSAVIGFVAVRTLARELAMFVRTMSVPNDPGTKECPRDGTVMPVERGDESKALCCPLCHRVLERV